MQHSSNSWITYCDLAHVLRIQDTDVDYIQTSTSIKPDIIPAAKGMCVKTFEKGRMTVLASRSKSKDLAACAAFAGQHVSTEGTN